MFQFVFVLLEDFFYFIKIVLGGSSTSPRNQYYTIRNLSILDCLFVFEMRHKIEAVVLVEVSDVIFSTRHL
jgi:hypothetical protein